MCLASDTRHAGAHRNTIRAVPQSEGIQPFQPHGLDVGPVYLGNAVEPVLALLKTQGEKGPLATVFPETLFYFSALGEISIMASQVP